VLALLLAIPAAAADRPAQARQDPPRPVFRSTASAVSVDVTVRDRSRRSVTDLNAGDFQVYDNGVLQRIDAVSYGKLPIDVTVALDVSYSVTGRVLDQLRRGVVQLVRDLDRNDRLKLVLFNMRVNRTTDFTNDVKAVENAMRDVSAGGGTAVLDAISVTLVSTAAPDRRHLIVFFTDGTDSSSITTPDVLAQVAQRSRATLAFVMPAGTRTISTSGGSIRGGAPLPSTTVTQTAAPVAPPVFLQLVKETGGSILPIGGGTDITAAYRSVLTAFRSAYVLYYTPTGVDRDGYHTIGVKTRREGLVVQARRGYFGS
jgi:VWFA-related protein